VEASFWGRLWTCRQTEYWMNEWRMISRMKPIAFKYKHDYARLTLFWIFAWRHKKKNSSKSEWIFSTFMTTGSSPHAQQWIFYATGNNPFNKSQWSHIIVNKPIFQKLIELVIYTQMAIKLTCQSRNHQKNKGQHSAMSTTNTSTQTPMLSIPYHL